MMENITVIGGAGSKQIVVNADELYEIMRLITTIEVSFQTELASKLKALANTKYYEGGEASKTMEHYDKMLNKVNEVGDLYNRANSEVFNLMNQWLEQDAKLREDFMKSFASDGRLAYNLQQLGGDQ